MCDCLLQRGGAAVLLIGGSCCRGQVRFRRLKPPRLLCDQCQTNARFCLQLCRCDGGGKEAGWSRKQVSGVGRCGFCCCGVPGRMQHVVSTVTTRRAFHETRWSQTWSYSQKYWLFSNLPVRAAKYGDTADECGEALFLCGKSLLELARFVIGLFLNFRLDCVDLSEDTLFTVTFHFSWYCPGGKGMLWSQDFLILMVHYSVMVVCG